MLLMQEEELCGRRLPLRAGRDRAGITGAPWMQLCKLPSCSLRATYFKMATSTPSEVENTLQRLSHHRGVRGVMILSNETGRVIKHTGAMLEGPPGTTTEEAVSSSKTHTSTSTSSGDNEVTGARSNGDAAAPMVNATVRKYADAVRRIVTSSREAVQGLDEKVT